jgi:AcrR family transcriptional regulator
VTTHEKLADGVERALAERRRRYEDEYERLLAAARHVMRERGTADPSVADILAACGLSTSAFYRYFPTKNDLMLALLRRARDATHRHLRQRLDARREPGERVEEWVRGMFAMLRTDELVAANRPFLLAHPRLLEQFPDQIEEGFAALTRLLADAVREAREAAGLSAHDAEQDARLAMHQVFGILIDHAVLRRPCKASLVDAVASYTLRAVLHPVPDPDIPGR